MSYDPRGRTPEGRAEQLAEGRALLAGLIRKQNVVGMWDVTMRRAYREAGRAAARSGLEDTMAYDPRGRTPEGRAEQLAEGRAQAEAHDRRAADLAHQPGSPATSAFDRVGYWDDQVAECEARWDRQDRLWRDLRRSAGQYPEPDDQAGVDRALAMREALAGQCTRVRQLRDAALEECEQFRSPPWSG